MSASRPKPWMSRALQVAAAYNLLWGAFVILFPLVPFGWAGLEPPNYPELWQCVGMVVGVYGVGYALAASDPFRHWPMVLVGLLGKVLGPIGFLQAALAGRLPWRAGWMIVANDLVWWLPFALILHGTYLAYRSHRRTLSPDVVRMSLRARTQHDTSLEELSERSPVLLVFMRHAGCTFCREALADLSKQRREIEGHGTRLVLVHMGSEEHGSRFFRRYGLQDVPRVSDPQRSLYRAFGLPRGGLMDLFGPKVWWRGFQAGILGRHGMGLRVGDGFQMPGVFLLFHGEILRSYRHQSSADRPDYLGLVTDSGTPQVA